MAKRIYKFDYDYASLEFEIDLEKFTPELAKETLNFFLWDYDHEADPIDEVLKKYALQAFFVGMGYNCYGCISNWNEEGFAPIDGSFGIKLVEYSSFEFIDNSLTMEVRDVQ